MTNSRSIQGILVLVLGTFVALWLGLSIVTSQIETILEVIGVAVLIVCLSLGRRIWILIPFGLALEIQLRLPGQPDSVLIAQMLVIGFCLLLFCMRKLPFHFQMTEMEFWVVILTILVAQVYFRNPVGISLFGDSTVGGKPYALFAISLASAFLLCGLRVEEKHLKWILPLSIGGGLMNLGIALVGLKVQAVAVMTGGTYNTTADSSYENYGQVVDARAADRIGYFLGFSRNLSLWVCSFISPLKACIKPLWGILMFGAIVAAMLSGFRNGVIWVGLAYTFAIAYRSGFSGLLLALVGASGGLALLALVNLMHPLPPNLQRSLTFLPGTWEERYEEDAAGSSDWRFEIWKEALVSDRWIRNKWIGDGLGFSAAELQAQMNQRENARAGVSGLGSHREAILANGDYHSGPVSTIRTIGYIGLAFFLAAQIRLAVHAHRQIIRTRYTQWLSLAMFIGLPMIVSPIFFVFVFGDFKRGAAMFLINFGMMRLLENNLPLPAYAKPLWQPYMLASGRNQRPVRGALTAQQSGA